jgi:hypothetical protein
MAAVGSDGLLFGGQTRASALLSDTWQWNGVDWTQLSPAGSPSARWEATMAAIGGQAVLYGGNTSPPNTLGISAQTWVWNGATWTLSTPSGVGPLPAYGATMTVDGTEVVRFGGVSGTNASSDVWSWDGAVWTALGMPGGTYPPARSDEGLAAVGGTIVVYGGRNDIGSSLVDTWTSPDGNTWNDVTPPATASPQPGFPAMTALGSGAVMFNGCETWTLSLTDLPSDGGTDAGSGNAGAGGRAGANGGAGAGGNAGAGGRAGASGGAGAAGNAGAGGRAGASGGAGAAGNAGAGGIAGGGGNGGKGSGGAAGRGVGGAGGNAGASGTGGASGTAGTGGSPGSGGASGAAGTTGQAGASGTGGASGAAGKAGATGTAGVSGKGGAGGSPGTGGSGGGDTGSSGCSCEIGGGPAPAGLAGTLLALTLVVGRRRARKTTTGPSVARPKRARL